MNRLREDAVAIWRAGVDAVDSVNAVRKHLSIEGDFLVIAGTRIRIPDMARIEVLGAGKAGTGMAEGIEACLSDSLLENKVSGWINVPEDCVKPLKRLHLHGARPPGVNEPTTAAVNGTREILQRAARLSERDLCIALISGGASALLCCPLDPVSLEEKLIVTRLLAAAGTPIQELNLVRTQLSKVKGGGLAAACHAGSLVSLIISDVIGDPLELIGSGPTVPTPPKAEEALQILQSRCGLHSIPQNVCRVLEEAAARQKAGGYQRDAAMHENGPAESFRTDDDEPLNQLRPTQPKLMHQIIASNAIALKAAKQFAQNLGYDVISLGSENAGDAADEGRRLMKRLTECRKTAGTKKPVCILSGGEPTVNLHSVSETPFKMPSGAATSVTPIRFGKGGRNQELVLAALEGCSHPSDWHDLILLSGGTDGEDGPTDAAGAICDRNVSERMLELHLNPTEFLRHHDSWNFFNAVNGLLQTGPTSTNVMDLRVALWNPRP